MSKPKYNATLEELEVISEATSKLLLLVKIFPNIKDKTLATDTYYPIHQKKP